MNGQIELVAAGILEEQKICADTIEGELNEATIGAHAVLYMNDEVALGDLTEIAKTRADTPPRGPSRDLRTKDLLVGENGKRPGETKTSREMSRYQMHSRHEL